MAANFFDNIIKYENDIGGSGGFEAVYADESDWLTQKMMGLLYDVEIQTIIL